MGKKPNVKVYFNFFFGLENMKPGVDSFTTLNCHESWRTTSTHLLQSEVGLMVPRSFDVAVERQYVIGTPTGSMAACMPPPPPPICDGSAPAWMAAMSSAPEFTM